MKKNLLIVLIAFLTLDLFSQIDKNDVIFSVNGNYVKTTTEDGATTIQNSSQIKDLSIGASFGCFITDRFIVGFGLDYYWNKESRISGLYINNYIQKELMKITSDALLPNVFVGYYYPIIGKFYINTHLKINYGKLKSDYNTLIVGSVNYPGDTITELNNTSTFLKTYEGNSKADYFYVNLFPELTYFITPNFGVCLGLGGIEYSMVDWKTDNSNWGINFNPVYWKFGIKIKTYRSAGKE